MCSLVTCPCRSERASPLADRMAATAGAFAGRLAEMPLALPQMCASLHLLDVGAGPKGGLAIRRVYAVVYTAFEPCSLAALTLLSACQPYQQKELPRDA